MDAIVSLLFEWIMPHYTDYNTADHSDVLAYFTGGLFYFLFHQLRHVEKKTIKHLPSCEAKIEPVAIKTRAVAYW